MEQNDAILKFPTQIMPKDADLTDAQLCEQVRIKLTHKLNRVARGEYTLTEEDKEDIATANDVFFRNGYPVIDVDLSQH